MTLKWRVSRWKWKGSSSWNLPAYWPNEGWDFGSSIPSSTPFPRQWFRGGLVWGLFNEANLLGFSVSFPVLLCCCRCCCTACEEWNRRRAKAHAIGISPFSSLFAFGFVRANNVTFLSLAIVFLLFLFLHLEDHVSGENCIFFPTLFIKNTIKCQRSWWILYPLNIYDWEY